MCVGSATSNASQCARTSQPCHLRRAPPPRWPTGSGGDLDDRHLGVDRSTSVDHKIGILNPAVKSERGSEVIIHGRPSGRRRTSRCEDAFVESVAMRCRRVRGLSRGGRHPDGHDPGVCGATGPPASQADQRFVRYNHHIKAVGNVW